MTNLEEKRRERKMPEILQQYLVYGGSLEETQQPIRPLLCTLFEQKVLGNAGQPVKVVEECINHPKVFKSGMNGNQRHRL